MNAFTTRVYDVASMIPKGKVATYGQIARLAGNAKAARAVGAAMRTNINTKRVPCHRVVGSDGSLTGYAYGNGVATKRSLLEKEKVSFARGKVNLLVSQWER